MLPGPIMFHRTKIKDSKLNFMSPPKSTLSLATYVAPQNIMHPQISMKSDHPYTPMTLHP